MQRMIFRENIDWPQIIRKVGYEPYENSVRKAEGKLYVMAQQNYSDYLVIMGQDILFDGNLLVSDGMCFKVCPMTHQNCIALQKRFPYTAPISLRGKKITMGLGDRLGLCSSAHIEV